MLLLSKVCLLDKFQRESRCLCPLLLVPADCICTGLLPLSILSNKEPTVGGSRPGGWQQTNADTVVDIKAGLPQMPPRL
jgi:hypothetical protein